MSKSVSPNAAATATHLTKLLQGNMEQNKLNALVTALQTPMTTYGPCIATLLSLVFYTRVQVGYPAGKNFNGNAGGIAAIPGGTGGGIFTLTILLGSTMTPSPSLTSLLRCTLAYSFMTRIIFS